ncbi:hypothetical protein ALC53_12743 [Atta colombica]|uniref:Uncharacterized protein n=1 Tax=Atta colombica TaxID=520822 RepID=A0A195AY35_9HYME|nr:hypothetical protein ALC53_12743 [Atta colombica]
MQITLLGKCQWLRTTVDPSTCNRGPFDWRERTTEQVRATGGTESEQKKRAYEIIRRKRDHKGEEKSVGTVKEAGEKSRARERRRDNKRKGSEQRRRAEKSGKAVPKWKRGKKEKESGPHPKERHDAGRPFASLAFFGAARRGAVRRGATRARVHGSRAPFVRGRQLEKSMVEAAGEREGGGGGGGGGGGTAVVKAGCKECHDLAQQTSPA